MSQLPEQLVRSAVLTLSADLAEWVERGPSGSFLYGRAPVGSLKPGDLVHAAAAAREAAGGRQRSCVLALGEGLLGLRPLVLPVLPRAETRQVLLRKAATLLGCDTQDALFTTIAKASGDQDAEGEALLLVALRRSAIRALRLALRRRGFRVDRVTSASLAPIERARYELVHPDAPFLVVNVGPRSSGVTLVAGARLINHDVLEGDLLEVPALAASLLQTVRTSAGYWRKAHRGALVEGVVVIGLPPERGVHLVSSIEAALPGARVSLLGGGEGKNACRAQALAACALDGPLAPDLTTPIPARRPMTAALLVVLIGLVLGLSALAAKHAGSTVSVVRGEAERLAVESRDLAALEEANREALQELEALRAKVDRARHFRAAGADYPGLLTGVLSALSGRAEFLALSVGRERDGGRELELRALTDADPIHSTTVLRAIETELSSDRGLRGVRVDVPSALSGTAGRVGRDGALEFRVEARVAE